MHGFFACPPRFCAPYHVFAPPGFLFMCGLGAWIFFQDFFHAQNSCVKVVQKTGLKTKNPCTPKRKIHAKSMREFMRQICASKLVRTRGSKHKIHAPPKRKNHARIRALIFAPPSLETALPMPHNYAIEKHMRMKKVNHMATFAPPRSFLTHRPTRHLLSLIFPPFPTASSIPFLAVNPPPYQFTFCPSPPPPPDISLEAFSTQKLWIKLLWNMRTV